MSRCTHIFKLNTQGKKLDPGGRCALEAGHKGHHLSEQALENRRKSERGTERKLRKARWNRENAYPKDCPKCGGPMSRQAKLCKECSKQALAPFRKKSARKMTERNKST